MDSQVKGQGLFLAWMYLWRNRKDCGKPELQGTAPLPIQMEIKDLLDLQAGLNFVLVNRQPSGKLENVSLTILQLRSTWNIDLTLH